MIRIIVSIMLALCNLAYAGVDVKTYIPTNAKPLLPTVQTEQQKYFPELDQPGYLAGLIEQESCISLTHSRCWSPRSTLDTSREYGVGLGMITKAFKPDGTVRFDSLSDLRRQHMTELSDMSWGNIKDRADLQIRSMLLMSRDNYKSLYRIQNKTERLKMTDAAYNAGLGRVIKDRTKCNLVEGCDAQLWDDNVELTCTASRTPIAMYGNKSPCRINREHVYNVFNIRMPKYQQYYNDIKATKPTPAVPVTEVVEPPKVVAIAKQIPNYWDRLLYWDFFFKYD